tara:strand:- start:316 stop:879 length:564 start_codon:yes stop_codon:yes gene_type:complete
MKLEDFIHVQSNVISSEICDEIMQEYKNSDDWVPGTVNDYDIAQSRKCEAIYLSDDETIQKNFSIRKNIDAKIFTIVNDACREYLRKHNALEYINIQGDTGYILLKYNVGDYVREHVDTNSGEHRTLSCSIMLNDEYEGADLLFFNGQYKPKLKKGDMVIFPSGFTYPHQVSPVISGTRYAIITWIK